MKLTLIFLFAFGVFVTSTPTPNQSLGQELKEFRKLLPFNKINALVFRYFANDNEFQELVDYILSDDVLPGFEEIEHIPEVQAIIEYLHSHGSDIYELLNKLHDVLGLDPFYQSALSTRGNLGGLKSFVENLKNLIPVEELWALYYHKLETSTVFREFVDFVKSPNSQVGMDKILENEHIRNLVRFVKSKNVDTKVLTDFITALVGIEIKPVSALYHNKPEIDFTEHVLDFLSFVPTENVIAYGNMYLKSSKEFRAAYLYLTSKMFQASCKAARKTKPGKELIEYIEMQGLNLKKYVRRVEAQSGFKRFNAKHADSDETPKNGTMTDFLNEVKSLLPTDQINELALNKTETVPNYVNFTMSLQSTELIEIFQKISVTEEGKNLISESLEFGIKLEVFMELAYTLIGIDFNNIFDPSFFQWNN